MFENLRRIFHREPDIPVKKESKYREEMDRRLASQFNNYSANNLTTVKVFQDEKDMIDKAVDHNIVACCKNSHRCYIYRDGKWLPLGELQWYHDNRWRKIVPDPHTQYWRLAEPLNEEEKKWLIIV